MNNVDNENNLRNEIDNWYKEHSEKLRIKKEQMINLISSKDYINWLISFLKKEHYFSDEDWIYFIDMFEDSDRLNMAKICLLYELVSSYASKNNIVISTCDYGNYYKVIYENFCFDIGVKLDKGIMFFCNKDIDDDNTNIIDFDNILLKKEEKALVMKKTRL